MKDQKDILITKPTKIINLKFLKIYIVTGLKIKESNCSNCTKCTKLYKHKLFSHNIPLPKPVERILYIRCFYTAESRAPLDG